jgi:hypothetical protein
MTDTTTAPVQTAANIMDMAQKILAGIADHEGLINTVADLAGFGPEVSMAEKILPVISSVLSFMEQETGKGLVQVVEDLLQHLTPGQPNSPVLSLPQAS